ncbi:Uncharacterised protein [Mycobacteroides abscessus subsp. abscessus]|nr:Uncharacterised protein [Mycobacteroides abscessus subsp. abscessus]SIG45181.1 Uncharacterised protein [Mycobacteroides abscessus subsp. abscessus]SIN27920.1 Uncharacterised protein [Mycobacteroides abscessus subsp. bolletii]SKZ91247.1 Uncharacterised protein [Mycobacteroides abscessus subsp. abscessus]SLC48600.1 Uncharacterised protein [Mycobacteroides abscessus subsp. abscessus]
MHFGDTDFGRPARILEARNGRRARAAGIAGHVDDIGACLGDTYRNGSDALGGHQFDDHPDSGRLAIVDQLGEVLDRVCVVVGRGRDELDTRCSTTGGRDLDGHLRSRKLAAFTGFSALADLDLEFLEHRVGKVAGPHPETAGGELLDAGAADSAVSADVLTALTAVGEAANQIGSMRHGLVCRGHQGAVAHGSRCQCRRDLAGRLHRGQRDRFRRCPDLRQVVRCLAGRGDPELIAHDLVVGDFSPESGAQR